MIKWVSAGAWWIAYIWKRKIIELYVSREKRIVCIRRNVFQHTCIYARHEYKEILGYINTTTIQYRKQPNDIQSLKMRRRIPKSHPNMTKTDKAIVKYTTTNGQTTAYTSHRKLQTKQFESQKQLGWSQVLRKGKKLLLHNCFNSYHAFIHNVSGS